MTAAGEPPEKPLYAWGFDPIFLDTERLNRTHLDEVSLTRPVVVQHSNFHLMTVNSAALDLADRTAPRSLRIGYFSQDQMDELREGGAEIVPLEVPELPDAMALSAILFTTEAYGLWKDVIEAAPDLMFPEILARFRSGAEFSGADYVAAWAKLEQVRMVWDQAVAGFDAVLAPAAPILPPNLARLQSDHDYYVTSNLMAPN